MTAPATPLILYNSLTRAPEPFRPIDPANVRVYSCGPTVYNYAHIGNLRAYVFTDTLSRVLRWKGWPLTHIINITDVGHLTSDADAGDDKMEAAARKSGQDIWAIAAHYTSAFKQNLKDLGIAEPTRFPLATEHVPQMIEFAKAIEDKHCYRLPDGLYFDVTTVPDYGRLARHQEDEGESRIDPVAGKRHPADFAIWRASAPGEQRRAAEQKGEPDSERTHGLPLRRGGGGRTMSPPGQGLKPARIAGLSRSPTGRSAGCPWARSASSSHGSRDAPPATPPGCSASCAGTGTGSGCRRRG